MYSACVSYIMIFCLKSGPVVKISLVTVFYFITSINVKPEGRGDPGHMWGN